MPREYKDIVANTWLPAPHIQLSHGPFGDLLASPTSLTSALAPVFCPYVR
jgi:hypothetical protein